MDDSSSLAVSSVSHIRPLYSTVSFNGDRTPSGSSRDQQLPIDYKSQLYSSSSSVTKSKGSDISLSSTSNGRISKQKLLQEELKGVQEECRKLRVQVEQRTNKTSSNSIERPVSSLSYRGNLSSRPIHYPLRSMNNSLSTSNTSLSSTTRDPTKSFSSAYSSALLDGPSTTVELEKAKIKIRKLEKELSVIEAQLTSKTKLAESHVEELTQLKSLLSQEKASHAVTLHQTQEKSANELGRLKGVHAQQCNELESQLSHYKNSAGKNEEYITKLKTELKGSQKEVKVLSENVSQLLKQLEEEREGHKLSMERVQGDVIEGQRKVTELKKDLKSYQQQLSQCMNEIETGKNEREKELTEEIELLTRQLHQCKDELLKCNHIIRQLQGELEIVQDQLRDSESERRREMEQQRQLIEENELTKRKLLDKLERTTKELSTVSERVVSLQQSSLVAHQLEGEVTQLRRSLNEQQKQRQGQERKRESAEREVERMKTERNDLKTRLNQCTTQLADMQHRSEEWRGEREKLNTKLKEIHSSLEEKNKQVLCLQNKLQDNETANEENHSSVNEMQVELTKRAQQVMDLDGALRKHQAETATKTLQLERSLAQRQADLRSQTQEMEELSKRYATANRTIESLQRQVNRPHSHDKNLSAVLHKTEQDNKQLQIELENSRQRESIAKEQMNTMRHAQHELQQKLYTIQQGGETHDHLIKSLKEEIKQLEERDKTGQEEVARCRAQVASLSAELSVERQILEETRDELAKARSTTSLISTSSLPSSILPPHTVLPPHTSVPHTSVPSLSTVPHTSVLPSTSSWPRHDNHVIHVPKLSFEGSSELGGSIISEVEYPQLPPSRTKPGPSTNRLPTNIIHI